MEKTIMGLPDFIQPFEKSIKETELYVHCWNGDNAEPVVYRYGTGQSQWPHIKCYLTTEFLHPDSKANVRKFKLVEIKESATASKEDQYEHIIMELLGVIGEYQAMPCDSLKQRMFAGYERYSKKFNEIKNGK